MADAETNRWLLIVALALLVAVPTGLTLWLRDASLVWPVTLACITAVLLIRLPDVELFKAGPVEARMRAATQKAEATIQQLQSLAAALSNPVLGAIMGSGQLGGYPREKSLAMMDRVVLELKNLGLKPDQVAAATEQSNFYLDAALFWDVYRIVGKETKDQPNYVPALRCFDGPDGQMTDRHNITDLKVCLERVGALSEEVKSALADVEQFRRDGTLRRRDVFIHRAD